MPLGILGSIGRCLIAAIVFYLLISCIALSDVGRKGLRNLFSDDQGDYFSMVPLSFRFREAIAEFQTLINYD